MASPKSTFGRSYRNPQNEVGSESAAKGVSEINEAGIFWLGVDVIPLC